MNTQHSFIAISVWLAASEAVLLACALACPRRWRQTCALSRRAATSGGYYTSLLTVVYIIQESKLRDTIEDRNRLQAKVSTKELKLLH